VLARRSGPRLLGGQQNDRLLTLAGWTLFEHANARNVHGAEEKLSERVEIDEITKAGLLGQLAAEADDVNGPAAHVLDVRRSPILVDETALGYERDRTAGLQPSECPVIEQTVSIKFASVGIAVLRGKPLFVVLIEDGGQASFE